MGELHLDIKVDILKRTHKVEVAVGAPQVAYREAITRKVTKDYPQEADRRHGPVRARHPRGRAQREGRGQCLRVQIVGGSVPKEYIPGVEKGLNSVLSSGPVIGFRSST